MYVYVYVCTLWVELDVKSRNLGFRVFGVLGLYGLIPPAKHGTAGQSSGMHPLTVLEVEQLNTWSRRGCIFRPRVQRGPPG